MFYSGMFLKKHACGRGYIEQFHKAEPDQEAKYQGIQRADFGQMPNTFVFVAQNHGRAKNKGSRADKEAKD